MKNTSAILFIGFTVLLVIVVASVLILQSVQTPRPAPATTPPLSTSMKSMKLQSSSFIHTSAIPSAYTCDGRNVNPPLAWSDAPDGVKSFALIVDDPDAPRGDWVHWLVWNIPPSVASIAENTVPAGAVEGMTDFGTPGYGGPCPPSGVHRYQFTLYALDTALDLPTSTKKSGLEAAMDGHVLDQSLLMGRYTR